MKVRKLEKNDLEELIKFNKIIFPKRNMTEEYFRIRLQKNENEIDLFSQSLIAVNDTEEIIGQILMMPSKFNYKGNIQTAFWGMDYIVDEKYRGSPIGTILCKKALKTEFHFGVGLSENSLAIHQTFGEKIIGQLSKYIRLTNVFSILNFIFPRKNTTTKFDFPENLKLRNSSFKLVDNPDEILSGNGFWNNNQLEFERDNSFIKWRYFHYKNKYFIYKLVSTDKKDNLTSFFVLRPIIWKKANCLLLVDYRITNENNFSEIIKASKKIAQQLKFSAIITGCSLPSLTKKLKKNFFFKFGEHLDIVSNYKSFNNEIDNDNVLVTFGDSDCDFYYGNDKW